MMSVMMGLVVSADPERFQQAINSDPKRLLDIAERAKQRGAIHHRFYVNEAGGEVLVVDEWPSADAFLEFFSNSPDIEQMMGEAGVTQEPQPVFWRELDTPDKF